jgi:RimJ/RimL family protein N-acetyltransferase
MLDLTEPVDTERLRLRPFVAADLDAVHTYLSLPEVVRYLYWEVQSRAEVRDLLRRRAAMTAWRDEGDRIYLAVVRREDDQLVGEIMLRLRSVVNRQGEIGFVFNPAFQGRGYATEAAAAMLDLAFGPGGMHRVYGSTDGRNAASAGLMARLGMRQEAHFRHNEIFKGEWGDELYYAVLEDEWRDLRRERPGPLR